MDKYSIQLHPSHKVTCRVVLTLAPKVKEQFIKTYKNEYDELYELGDSPLINKEDYTLEPFSLDKYKDTDRYISLKNYSRELYSFYMAMYDELQYILHKQSA